VEALLTRAAHRHRLALGTSGLHRPVGPGRGRRMYVYYGAGSGRSIAANLGGAVGVRVYQLPRRP